MGVYLNRNEPLKSRNRKRITLLTIAICLVISSFAQQVTLTFTGSDANHNDCQLDWVIVSNLTRNWSDTLYWPDLTLVMQNVSGIEDVVGNSTFGLLQNNPNPFNGTTETYLTTLDAGVVVLEVSDVNGRVVAKTQLPSLQAGTHQFRIHVATAGIFHKMRRFLRRTPPIMCEPMPSTARAYRTAWR